MAYPSVRLVSSIPAGAKLFSVPSQIFVFPPENFPRHLSIGILIIGSSEEGRLFASQSVMDQALRDCVGALRLGRPQLGIFTAEKGLLAGASGLGGGDVGTWGESCPKDPSIGLSGWQESFVEAARIFWVTMAGRYLCHL